MRTGLPILLSALLLFPACGEKRSEPQLKQRPDFTGNPHTDIPQLLPPGPVTVERMDGVKRDARLVDLHSMFQKGIREHYDWYVDYLEIHPGRPVPYHENMGMSEEEYAEMNERIGNTRYYSTGLQEIKIVRRGERIGFEADKKLEVLQSVAFNPRTLQAQIGEYPLTLTDTTAETTGRNPFGNTWKGYLWRYENPADIHLEALKDLGNLDVVQYKITLGRFDQSGQTLLTIQCVEVKDGFKLVDVDLSVIF